MAVRVLVAGDSPLVQRAIRRLLEAAGVSVVEARDVCEAVRLARDTRPDVVVLEYSTTGRCGLNAVRALRLARPEANLVALAAVATEYDILAALSTGVRGVVLTTDAGDDLLRAIQRVCSGSTFVSPGASRVFYEPYLPKADRL